MSRDTRSQALVSLRDLIVVGNLMAMKIGQEPTNLANTWDEMIERLRASGVLHSLALADVMVDKCEAHYLKCAEEERKKT